MKMGGFSSTVLVNMQMSFIIRHKYVGEAKYKVENLYWDLVNLDTCVDRCLSHLSKKNKLEDMNKTASFLFRLKNSCFG